MCQPNSLFVLFCFSNSPILFDFLASFMMEGVIIFSFMCMQITFFDSLCVKTPFF